jgi:hypothetical protein
MSAIVEAMGRALWPSSVSAFRLTMNGQFRNAWMLSAVKRGEEPSDG